MNDAQDLINVGLERAAEALGDITAPAMARFYATHPEAREAFEHHGQDQRERLEADMVGNALYCAMTWRERPMEIRIQMDSSVPHHEDILHIALPWFRGLQDAVIDTIPAGEAEEQALWAGIRRDLGEAVAASALV